MIPALLITFRETIEAALIVATILGVLVKRGQTNRIRTVWLATGVAAAASGVLVGLGSAFGMQVQKWYVGKTEAMIEGGLMIVSSLFITWAVFFLHNYFGRHKVHLLQKIKETVETREKHGIFLLVFTAVIREGIEVAAFLTTEYISSAPLLILSGVVLGVTSALLVSFGLLTATLRFSPVRTFQVTSFLLIMFAGGLLGRGVHEFIEAGLLPQAGSITFLFLPQKDVFIAELLSAVFGIARKMDSIQIIAYGGYVATMMWWIGKRRKRDRQGQTTWEGRTV